MDAVLITTLFVAPPARLTEAYELYRTRANAADAAVLAQSTHPRPVTDDPYTLWELRSEAAFYRLTQPQKMELFELRSLVRYNSDDDKIFDRVHEKFFFEDHDEPTVFPGQVSQSPSVKLPESAPERMPGQLNYLRISFLSQETNATTVSQTFQKFIEKVAAFAYLEDTEGCISSENPKIAGPLWVRNSTHTAAGVGDGAFPLAKHLWVGYALCEASADEAAALLPDRTDPDCTILGQVEQLDTLTTNLAE
ncbi:hypothetical protein [Corynebacterium phoceense]|uniref:Uncharacterized protein n=1 Tax=Corynebacterium phoceense TaxID=1686286 RepID=A0A540R7F6_9CORY|nr:hypothetical protein [Corynebacterium phoceense]MBF9010507.1 hypothetical protein [Corynebacterium phoceense]TQE43679.1 hypothetical protein EJK80_05260 [Corynebacterium phoceense]